MTQKKTEEMKQNERQWIKNPMEIMRCFYFFCFEFYVPAHDQSIDSLTSFTVNKTMMTMAKQKKRVRVCNGYGKKSFRMCVPVFFHSHFPTEHMSIEKIMYCMQNALNSRGIQF